MSISFDGVAFEMLKNLRAESTSENTRLARASLQNVHQAVYGQFRSQNFSLIVLRPIANAVEQRTATAPAESNILTVAYIRRLNQAASIERLMGREDIATAQTIDPMRHPVIEMRVSQHGFTLELVMGPDAWWDQQNFVGKLTVGRHRDDFHGYLRHLGAGYALGFWQGIHLSEMHLTGLHLQHRRIVDEWLGTFAPTKDWFRLGIWYAADDERLKQPTFLEDINIQIKALHDIYEFACWSSNNNFRDFYPGLVNQG